MYYQQNNVNQIIDGGLQEIKINVKLTNHVWCRDYQKSMRTLSLQPTRQSHAVHSVHITLYKISYCTMCTITYYRVLGNVLYTLYIVCIIYTVHSGSCTSVHCIQCTVYTLHSTG